MRLILFVAFAIATLTSFSQGKTLVSVDIVKPKQGQVSAFETAWKAHVNKFHKERKLFVYEILSGNHAGAYQIVEGPISYADLDKVWPNQSAHDRDLEQFLSPRVESGSGPFYYAHRDTLGFNPDIQSDKALITITRVKNGKMNDYIQEVRRTAILANELKAPFGVNAYVQLFAGSDPTIVTIRSLKDGFKELENNYFNRPANEFQNGYLKKYSQQQWDKRTSIMNDDINSREVFMTRFRKDLSSN